MAAKTLTAVLVPAGQTVTTRDGTPYRGDPGGITFTLSAAHATELGARGFAAPSQAQLAQAGQGHEGQSGTYKVQEG